MPLRLFRVETDSLRICRWLVLFFEKDSESTLIKFFPINLNH